MTASAEADASANAGAPGGARGFTGRLLSDPMLAIVDQAAVSGTRFATTIAVGKFAGAEELGVYALAMAALILAGCVQESIVTKPYIVLRSGRGDRRYAGSVLTHHLLLGAGLALGFLIAAGVCRATGATGAAATLACLTAVTPLSLLWEFARRMSFAHLNLRGALAIDLSLAAVQITGLGLLAWTERLTAATALGVTGVSAALAGGVWLALRRDLFAPRLRRAWSDAGRNWRFGRWILAGQFCGQLTGQTPLWILAAVAGTTAGGLLAAAQTVVLLSNPLILAIAGLLVPQTAAARRAGGPAAVRRVALRAGALLAGVAGLFWLGLLVAAEPLLTLIYDEEFAAAAPAIVVLGLAPIAWSLNTAFDAGLSAIDRPELGFRAMFTGLAVTATAAAALSGSLGPVGAAAALTLGSAATTAILGYHFLRLTGTTPAA